MSTFSILNPVVYDDMPLQATASRLDGVRGARIAFVNNSKVNADVFLDRVSTVLGERHGVVSTDVIRKLAPKDDLSDAELAQLVGYDAVVQGIGD